MVKSWAAMATAILVITSLLADFAHGPLGWEGPTNSAVTRGQPMAFPEGGWTLNLTTPVVGWMNLSGGREASHSRG